MSARACLALAALLVAAPADALTGDIGRLTMGRVTSPKGAWVFDLYQDHVVPRWSPGTHHVLSQRVVTAYGVSDRFTAAAVALADHAEHEWRSADRWGTAAAVRVLDEPLQVAALAVALRHASGRRFEFAAGADLLMNVGSWSAQLRYFDEFRQGEGESAVGGNHHILEPGLYYRFGLHGIVGIKYLFQTLPPAVFLAQGPMGPVPVPLPARTIRMIGPVMGGSISKNLFLGLDQSFGMGRDSPTFITTLQFQLYFGPYALGSWGL